MARLALSAGDDPKTDGRSEAVATAEKEGVQLLDELVGVVNRRDEMLHDARKWLGVQQAYLQPAKLARRTFEAATRRT